MITSAHVVKEFYRQLCKIARPNYDSLTWEDHTNAICKTISSGTATLKRVRRCICKDTAEKICHSLIETYFNYCCTCLAVSDGIGSQLRSKLQKLQNRVARCVIAGHSYETSSNVVLEELNWNIHTI